MSELTQSKSFTLDLNSPHSSISLHYHTYQLQHFSSGIFTALRFLLILPEDDIYDVFSDVFSNCSDSSYTSDLDNAPNTVQYDLSNGAPFDTTNFSILHFNINSVLKDGRLDELQTLCRTLNIGILILYSEDQTQSGCEPVMQ